MSAEAPGQILTAEQARLRADLRAALDDLGGMLEAVGASAEDRRRLDDAARGLDELFLLVVVGEFNAGKSALLNELLGTRLLAEGVTPTTAAITLVRRGERETEEWRGAALLERRLPAEVLRDLAVVDTPGTNAIVRQHETLTREFVPRADLILFVTSADRPFTESERELLGAIREWGKKIVVVVNKIDLLEGAGALEQVLGFVGEGLRRTLQMTPPLFGASVRLARLAAENGDPAAARALRAASRIDELRRYVFETLDEAERLRLKLSTPVGVAERLLQRYGSVVAERRSALEEDLRLVENVDRQLGLYADDLRRSFGPRLAGIENVVHELNDRGEQFFEETVRLGRVFDLLNPERTRGAFEREVVGDAAARLDRLVGEVVDWFVEAEQRLWRQLSAMVRQRQQSAVGAGEDPDFVSARREVLRAVSERTGAALVGFDREREAREFGQSMRDAVAQTALAEIGAVSLGAAIALLFGTVAADVTGLLAATLAAGLGLYILPARKRKAVRQFRDKTEGLRRRLVEALQSAMEREIGQSTERVREAIAPYTRHVRAEGVRLAEQQAGLDELGQRIGRLRARVGG
ncbi:MAG TPA: dynamin family protein [Chloroflexota bacterium]|jgi:small GTP-binding protein|nr:dynamin family protein [Chloroflexota bacterium]